MNAMEVRTSAALHTVADGLVVSEHDLDRLEGTIMALLDAHTGPVRTRAPRGRWDWAVAAIAVVALVLGGLALWQANRTRTTPPTAPPQTLTGDQPLVPPWLAGVWHNFPDSGWVWEFGVDGHMGWTETPQAYLRGEGAMNTITKRQGDVYTVVEHQGDGEPCSSHQRIRQTGAGVVTVTVLTNTCGHEVGMVLELERVTPRDATVPPLKARFARGGKQTVRTILQIEGSWVEPQSGTLLVVGRPTLDGGLTYVVDRDGDASVSPDQRGSVYFAKDGSTLAKPHSGNTRGCAPAFTRVVTDYATMTTTSGPGGCFPAGSTQTWLRLS